MRRSEMIFEEDAWTLIFIAGLIFLVALAWPH